MKDTKSNTEQKIDLAVSFWNAVGSHIEDWNLVKAGAKKSSDVRHNSICSLSITLVAIGTAGRALLSAFPDNWNEKLSALEQVDWSKSNPVWADLVFVNGRVAANRSTQYALSTYFEKLLLKVEGE